MSRLRSIGLNPSLALLMSLAMTILPGLVLVAQEKNEELLLELMKERGESFETVLSDPMRHRVQILYTQIDRNENNEPEFHSYSYRLDPESYFYPASSIKIFGAALALEKFNRLEVPDLNKDAWVRIDSSYSGQTLALSDTTAASGRPSFAHYIKKLLVLSDNDAYNRTYEFVGQEALNEGLRAKGYEKIRLTHRLSVALTPEENRHTNAMEFYSPNQERVIFRQGPLRSSSDYRFGDPILLGRAHVLGDKLIEEPMDFSAKNYCSVEELQKALRSLIFPESLRKEERFDLTEQDYLFLRKYLSQLPRETLHPDYRSKPDNYCKFFLYGDDESLRIPENVRIFNKIGLAYGFCIDNAYIVDFENGIEFLLTAVIYANQNETLNDGIYEYETVSFPFLAELGRMIYDYELKRPRERKPDLYSFRLTYDLPADENEPK